MDKLQKRIWLNLIAAVAYFIGGWLGTLLATPLTNISPVWPAAGVALAAMLSYRTAVLPGIFIGALTAQFYAFLDVSSLERIVESLGIGAMASIGSCLQAWFGLWLFERWIGKQDALIEDGKILRFFLLIVISCLLAPTVGVLSLYSRDVISVHHLAGSWSTWWAGDAIGAATVTPLLLLFVGRPRPIWQARRRFVLYPLLLVIVLVVGAFEFSRRQDDLRLENLFARQVQLLHTTIEEHLRDHVATNMALRSFFDSSETVSREEFISFSESIRHQHSGILEWTQRVGRAERARWEQVNGRPIRQLTGKQDLKLADASGLYFPVTYVVPQAGNERALGYDISSNPQVAPVVFKAIDTGEMLATGPVHLIQDTDDKRSSVIYAPVYAKHRPLQTVEERRAAFVGFVATAFRIENDMQAILSWLGRNQLQLLLNIYDQDQLIYSNLPPDFHRNPSSAKFGASRNIEFAGRHWRLYFLPAAEFFHLQQSPLSGWLLLGGFLLSGLTAFGLLLLTGRTARVEDLVAARTVDLSRSNAALNQEIALRRRHENELRVAATTFESHEAILVTDAEGSILKVNKAFTEITGYGAEEVIGQNPRLLSSGRHERDFFLQMYRALAKNNQWKGEIWNRRKNGELYPELLTITGVRDDQNRLTHYVAIFSDISAQKAAEKEIHHLAFYDPLTNLPNRRLLLDRLQHEIAAAKRQHCYGALFFLDLDHFKNLNDSRGHQVGDELLVQVAQRLKSIIRDEDTACRLGGDEFIVLMPGRLFDLHQATNHAAMLAEKILLAINQPFVVQGSEHHFSTSIGVTLYPETIEHPEDVIQQADTAMYRAKEGGRNGISFYRPSMQEAADKRLTMEKEMRKALQDGQFVLYYQPQVDMQNKRVASAEALIRWLHPEKGMISPLDFIPLAEDTQLIQPIGAWVLREACRQIKAWDRLGHRIDHVAVNVSSRQFRQSSFVQQVRLALLDAGIGAERLVIELTEGCVIEDIDDTIAKMHALQVMGVRISIDDFGIGYSSLSYLKSLPLSQLKIDQSFVRHIDDPNAAVIVETIIMMAKSLGLNVIAEGVETQAQIDFLSAKRCLFFQGFYFGKPVASHEFVFRL
ncbi:EAL domain-containing protein [Methylomonas rapida]|uniref:EAL domain-containing protein n=1 Tax=Methylomonas rapida TaxID=2963939 RepID=A0ABY7GI78_9GAMM|nr:EAL domain-containing protein [Methylomonas rapida]WAR44539.1 EAL domain-containing protein [Methylomonas rapida]